MIANEMGMSFFSNQSSDRFIEAFIQACLKAGNN